MSRRNRKSIDVFNISFLDLLSGALGAVIILFITIPKNQPQASKPIQEVSCSNTVDKKVLDKCMSTLKEKNEIVKQQRSELNEIIAEQSKLLTKLEKTQKQTKYQDQKKKEDQKNTGVGDSDVGFKFKGKNIVFLIDVSGSMRGEKIGQVKAGLKMLIASMGQEYKVDVVYFPHSPKQNYYSLWGVLQAMSTIDVKQEVYEFLAKLKPRGSTPTRSALIYALSQYPELTDIILLSDGSPTIPGSRKLDNYKDLIKDVTWHNGTKVQINTIGVGQTVFKNKSSDLYQFLKQLSGSTKGFFYGF